MWFHERWSEWSRWDRGSLLNSKIHVYSLIILNYVIMLMLFIHYLLIVVTVMPTSIPIPTPTLDPPFIPTTFNDTIPTGTAIGVGGKVSTLSVSIPISISSTTLNATWSTEATTTATANVSILVLMLVLVLSGYVAIRVYAFLIVFKGHVCEIVLRKRLSVIMVAMVAAGWVSASSCVWVCIQAITLSPIVVIVVVVVVWHCIFCCGGGPRMWVKSRFCR